MDEKNYIDLVNENIELSKLLYKVAPENRDTVISLLNQKKQILQKNGIFANFKLNKINKKIQKYIST